MSPDEAARRERLWTAMQRFTELGLLLPSLEDFEQAISDDKVATVAEVEMVLAEMQRVKTAIEDVMAEQERAAD